jgi:hypothetical protein
MIRGNVCNFDFSSVDYDLSAAFLASPLGWSSWSTLLFWGGGIGEANKEKIWWAGVGLHDWWRASLALIDVKRRHSSDIFRSETRGGKLYLVIVVERHGTKHRYRKVIRYLQTNICSCRSTHARL